jgi:cytochrome c-550 PedF
METRPMSPKHLAAATLLAGTIASAFAHGDVTPQAVDTRELPTLGASWRADNPYRGNEAAIRIGTSAFAQNCARCHGIDAISGGIAPDLRKMDNECATLKVEKKKAACVAEIDNFFSTTVRNGRTRNGAVYMPPFEGILNQEAVWAIKAYLETRRERPIDQASTK